jgi:hypothetical protein
MTWSPRCSHRPGTETPSDPMPPHRWKGPGAATELADDDAIDSAE